jgi:hypothetical protein
MEAVPEHLPLAEGLQAPEREPAQLLSAGELQALEPAREQQEPVVLEQPWSWRLLSDTE